MDEEFGYDSDQIDEETEARFYEMAYYGTSSLEKSTLSAEKCDNFSQRPINKLPEQDDKSDPDLTKAVNLLSNLKNGDSNKSSSDENLSQSVISISSGLSSLEDILKDKERYQTTMEALYLLITGNYPHCVLERAKKREQEYKCNQLSFRRTNSYYSAVTDDDDDDDDYIEPPRKSSKMDLILGISNTSDRKHNRDVVPEWFENLPSDPKLWTIDPDDLYPDDEYYNSPDFNGTCENCGLKGHSEEECTRSGPFCVICAREGHTKDGCRYRVCPICLERGHDSKCRNKHKVNSTVCFRCKQMGHMTNRCPEIWRQYRFTTAPGPPVKFEQPEPKVKRCFNCGRIGHLGHQCNRPSAYGQTLLYQGVIQFDKKDVFAEIPAKSKPEYEIVEKQSTGDSSAVKERTFDEPLYISFTSGPSNSLPEPNKLLLDTSKDESANECVDRTVQILFYITNMGVYLISSDFRNQGKNKRDRLHSLRHGSNYTPNRRDRRKTFGGSRDHFSPTNRHDSSALNGFLSEDLDRRRKKKSKLGDDNHQNSQPNLFISNGFTSTNPKRGHSFGKGNRKRFRGKSPKNSQMQSQFNPSHRRDNQKNRGNSSKSPNSRYRSQVSPLRRILEHRDKILKVNKRRNSDRKSLPNIGNSPYWKFISKSIRNSRSPVSSSPKQQKIVWKNRLSR
ncbi:unnamed protein product [Hymenolepis diminuta]|uniref:Zinc finger CCHC domain-containing protein 7 n=1 Tax=Hymenolepis diminuta TaxID=6216 RepID=A0A158QFN2_HYMDI|nr:unnamed protein product [Hymenolepis diminuta]